MNTTIGKYTKSNSPEKSMDNLFGVNYSTIVSKSSLINLKVFIFRSSSVGGIWVADLKVMCLKGQESSW